MKSRREIVIWADFPGANPSEAIYSNDSIIKSLL
jgi:hypothetical protein